MAIGKSPAISANSPKLCVATAQPISHSSVRSGGLIDCERCIAFVAHKVACALYSAGESIVSGVCAEAGALEGFVFRIDLASVLERSGGGFVKDGGGRCWAIDVARLFIIITL